MKKRTLAILLSAILLISMMATGLVLPMTAQALDWSGATATTVGKFMTATDADNAHNILRNAAGPYVGTGTSLPGHDAGESHEALVDGAFEGASHAGRVEYWVTDTTVTPGATAQFTYHLNEEYAITHFLTATEASSARFVQDIKIYAGTELATLYTADNLVVDAQDVNMQNVYYAGEETTAKYVGFEFYIPDENVWGKRLMLCELGAYIATDIELTEKPFTATTDARLKENVLPMAAGPYSGTGTSQPGHDAGESHEALVDGAFEGDGHAGRVEYWVADTTATPGATAQFTYHLDAEYTVNGFLTSTEAYNVRWLQDVKIYAGTDLATLYTDDNLVVDAKGVNMQSAAYTCAETKATYVGFEFYIPDDNVWGKRLNLCELGVYTVETEDKGYAATDDADNANNILTKADGPYSGTGTTQPGHDTGESYEALVDGAFEGDAHAGRVEFWVADTTATPGATAQFTYHLDGEYIVNRFLTATEANATRFVQDIKIYAGTDLATLYTAANLVVDVQDVNLQNVRYTCKDTAATYVGFEFYIPDDNVWGKRLNLCELGVYGTAVEKCFVATDDADNANNILKTANGPYSGTGTTQPGHDAGESHEALIDGAFEGDSHAGRVEYWVADTTATPGATAQFTYHLDGEYTLNKFLTSTEASTARYLQDVKIYAGTDLSTLYTDDNLVVDAKRVNMQTVAYTCPSTRASYVGFEFILPADNAWSKRLMLCELGAYGTKLADDMSFETFDSEEEMTALLEGKVNLLKGEAVQNKTADFLPMMGITAFEGGKEEYLTDGIVDWEGVESDKRNRVTYVNKGSSVFPYYDLRGPVALDGVMVANYSQEGTTTRIQRVRIYVGDDVNVLFSTDNFVGVANLNGTSVGAYISLKNMNLTGRYIGFDIPGDETNRRTRIAELGVYGTYTAPVRDFGTNLLTGSNAKLTDIFQVSALGIDNSTKVDHTGAPGTGNTGALTGKQNLYSYEDPANLLDGICYRGDNGWVGRCQLTFVRSSSSNVLCADTPWPVLIYYLGGGSTLNNITLTNAPDANYYVSGVQFYASSTYADLFKSESLLYTTGGEKYVLNSYNEPEPDVSTEMRQNQNITYELTDEQRAQTYRYVAFVITRPYAYYMADGVTRASGGTQVRLADLSVEGNVVAAEEPIVDTFTADTTAGKVTVQVQQLNFDDRAFFDGLGGLTVTETKLPAGVKRNIENNWLTVDGNTVYHIQLKDKNGKLVTDTGGRNVAINFACNATYTQTMAKLEDGNLTRIFNAFTQKDGSMQCGWLTSPKYDDTVVNIQEKSAIHTGDIQLVFLKYNDLDTMNKLNGTFAQPPVEMQADATVKGAAQKTAAAPVWLWVLLTAIAMAAVACPVVYRVRKEG